MHETNAVRLSFFELNSPQEVQETTQVLNNGSTPQTMGVHPYSWTCRCLCQTSLSILRQWRGQGPSAELGLLPSCVTQSPPLGDVLPPSCRISCGTVSSMLLLRLSWPDTCLAWNTSVYPQHVVTLSWGSLWMPGLTIQEALWADWQDQKPQARVDSDGHVKLYLALTTETNCDCDFHFPRDHTNGSLSFFALGNAAKSHPSLRPLSSGKRCSCHPMILYCSASSTVFQLRLQNRALKAIMALLVPGEALLFADVAGSAQLFFLQPTAQ
ncbi:hypothetical protein MC885_006821 [Smutsia gigantea]|nr:hypothetical protein MC885_006821 [Smutsia gigantea]